MPITMLFDPHDGGEKRMLLPSNPEHFVLLLASAMTVDGESAKAAMTQNKDRPLIAEMRVARRFPGRTMPKDPPLPQTRFLHNPTFRAPIDQSTGRMCRCFK